MSEKSDLELLAGLGITPEKKARAARTPKEARIIAGFEDIQRFVKEHGHAPRHGPELDIFERLYAVRLERLRAQKDCQDLLSDIDHQGLLEVQAEEPDLDSLDDEALLATLGLEADENSNSITNLTHVRSTAEKREAAEEIADRKPCEDFAQFEPLFNAVREDLASERRVTRPYSRVAGNNQTTLLEQGQFYVLNGVTAYVATIDELERTKHGYQDGRLRVIFDNGTESNLLFQSLHKALREDDTGRLISEPNAGPLFNAPEAVEGTETGTIYVLRSLSEQDDIAARREIIHKIGVTGGNVKKRITNASNEATFLLADVEIVAEFKLYDIDRTKLENLLHLFFSPARLEIELKDRFGKSVKPREWFLVPLPVIKEAIERVVDKSLHRYRYEPSKAALVEV